MQKSLNFYLIILIQWYCWNIFIGHLMNFNYISCSFRNECRKNLENLCLLKCRNENDLKCESGNDLNSSEKKPWYSQKQIQNRVECCQCMAGVHIKNLVKKLSFQMFWLFKLKAISQQLVPIFVSIDCLNSHWQIDIHHSKGRALFLHYMEHI